jgi:hypothetical protein
MRDELMQQILERLFATPLDPQRAPEFRHENMALDMPQSGERISGRENLQAMQEAYPGGPPQTTQRRLTSSSDLWVLEGTADYQGRIYHVVAILEWREGKIAHETRYYADPLLAPSWRSHWIEKTGPCE